MPDIAFLPGKELSRKLHEECIRPILARHYPGMAYSAGLLGHGSEVLDFDTPMSRDHDWGPRLQVFIKEDNLHLKQHIWDTFAQELPKTFYGYPTHFGPPNEADKGTRHLSIKEQGPVDHRIHISTFPEYLNEYLPVNVFGEIKPQDWLVIPQQKLRTVVCGGVFHDGLNALLPMQEKLRWYPEPIWYYLLASGFSRIGQEEHLMGRCGDVGDEIGSAQLGAHLTRTIMLLAFWMEKTYAPYHKWFGSGFKQLAIAEKLTPALHAIRLADTWQEREKGLVAAYLRLLHKFNALGLVEPVEEKTESFFGRPFQVIYSDRVVEKLKKVYADSPLAEFPLIGGADLITSSTDVLENDPVCARMKALF